jgi:PAS domain S-box-containing protein
MTCLLSERIDYEHRHRQLVERLPAIVYRASVLDSGDWHYVSPAIERVLGWTVEEWRAHPASWGTSIHPHDLDAAIEQEQRAAAGGMLNSEYRLRHRNGSDVWIHDEAVLLEENGEPLWHGILTDVTEKHTLDERLRKPFTDQELRAAIRRALDSDAAEQHAAVVTP